MTKLKTECETCSKTFYRAEKQLALFNHHFCCRQCYYNYRYKHPQVYGTDRYTKQLKKILDFAEKRKVGTKGE